MLRDLDLHNKQFHEDLPVSKQQLLKVACGICGKIINPKSLEAHKRNVHSSQEERLSQKISCHLCGRKFLQCSMKKHMVWMHSDEQTLKRLLAKCDYCGL
jgi:DNA-directed RNA polymerase subunit RPC12/RpoP